MRILQQHVDFIEYEPVEKEFPYAEESDRKKRRMEDALVLFTSVERGDDSGTAKRAVSDAGEFAKRMKIKRLLIYPFVHLTDSPEEPRKALELLKQMEKDAGAAGLEVQRAPFGWNKQFQLKIKAHPLAEQSRSYGAGASKPSKAQKARKIDSSIVRKSDWSGLPDSDHRTIGEKLDLYSFQEVSPGMVYWHHNGLIMLKEIMKFMREKLEEYGYKEIATPSVANLALWSMSGHLEAYKGNMFIFDANGEQLGLRAMGCPSAILVYKSRKWSYKELPFRAAEFDTIYRNEVSGALTGLFRVRQLTQDDAHVFAREDQIDDELAAMLRLTKDVYATFGMKYELFLSTMPEEHLGLKELWDRATTHLKSVLDKSRLKYGVKEKEGAFYGPKIDGDVLDSMGRRWQCLTIQLDYQQPARFKLGYTGEKGKDESPAILHRTIMGSLERFIGVLVEHYQGKFPLWLAPVQAKVISISEQSNGYAEKANGELKKNGIRSELDVSDRTLEYKIREAQLQKVPLMLILGKKEQESGTVTVRYLAGRQRHDVKIGSLVAELKISIEKRSPTP